MHPDLLRLATALQQENFAEALALIDSMLKWAPQSRGLRWKRIKCLEKLHRYWEVMPELEALLNLRPDHGRALIKRAQYAFWGVENAACLAGEAVIPQLFSVGLRRPGLASAKFHAIEYDLRRALALEPDNPEGRLELAALVLDRDQGPNWGAEAEAQLTRAIKLAPKRLELLEARARLRHARSARLGAQAAAPDRIETYAGQRHSRARLEASLADWQVCRTLSGDARHWVGGGLVLHDLGRFDEALAWYDQALDTLAPDHPLRPVLAELRARSDHQGAGERIQFADLLEAALAGDDPQPGRLDATAARLLRSVAGAIRSGQSLGAAVESGADATSDLLVATSITQHLLDLTQDAQPDLVAVNAADYPAYQRAFVDRVAKDMEMLGLRRVGDAEANGRFTLLGKRVLVRLFTDDAGLIGVSAYALKPDWPGWLGLARMVLRGQWAVTRVVECVTQFNDGARLATQQGPGGPLPAGGRLKVERLSGETSIKSLVECHLRRVETHLAVHPGSIALASNGWEGARRHWCQDLQTRKSCRASIGYVTGSSWWIRLAQELESVMDKLRRRPVSQQRAG